jgi:hypothetical protein
LQSDGISGLVTEEWAKRGRRLISPVFSRWALAKGLLNHYSNFGDERALSNSRRPPGVNFQGASKQNSSEFSFPSEDEIRTYIGKLDDIRTMSPCFDPIDLSLNEHIARYKMLVTTEDSPFSKQLECCLGLFRIYPLPLEQASSKYPRLVLKPSLSGCFAFDPLEIAQKLTFNTRFISIDGLEVMTFQADDGAHFHTRLLHHYDPQMNLITANGSCNSYYCPFTPGLYPDKL